MKCRICDQEMTEGGTDHHLERSPVERSLCLGCWIGWIEVEKFLFRATGRMYWSLNVYEAMRKLIEFTALGPKAEG